MGSRTPRVSICNHLPQLSNVKRCGCPQLLIWTINIHASQSSRHPHTRAKFLRPESYYHTIFHTLEYHQHIFKYWADAINTIASPILTNSIIQSYQPFHNTIYRDDTGTGRTIPMFFHNTYTPQLPIPIHKTTNSPIFQTIDNIIVQFICIYDKNLSTIIWDGRHCPPPITRNITNMFTSKTKSTLFQKILPNHPQIICSLQNLYENPI